MFWPFKRKKWEEVATEDSIPSEEDQYLDEKDELIPISVNETRVIVDSTIENDKDNLEDKIRGQNFYLNSPEEEFTKSVSSWLDYLEIKDLFPNLDQMPAKIIEIGDKLRDAGDASFLGLAEKGTNTLLIRPGDYAVLLHELVHANPEYENNLLSSEAGAFATSIFTCGDFEGEIESLLNGKSYCPDDKRKGRIVAEASLVLGREVLDYLKTKDNQTSIVTLVTELKELVDQYEQEFFDSDKTAVDYLIENHGLTENVAKFLLHVTKDTKETIVKSTSQTKKEIIGSFKSLVSFYHVNLNYDLDTAIDKTEKHFLDMEAMTIHKTLTNGAKDVFAKLKEYGYNLDVCRGISEAMISRGATNSISYAEGLPKFLELTGQYGPRGVELLDFAVKNPNFFDIMCLSDAASGLILLSETEPEQVGLVLEKLLKYKWNHELTTNTHSVLSLGYLYDRHKSEMRTLNPEDKAGSAALTLYLSSMPENIANKIAGGFDVSNHISNSYKDLFKYLRISDNGHIDSKKLVKLIKTVKQKTDKLLPSPDYKLIEDKNMN